LFSSEEEAGTLTRSSIRINGEFGRLYHQFGGKFNSIALDCPLQEMAAGRPCPRAHCGVLRVTSTRKATGALALILALASSVPAFSQTQLGVNFTNGDRLSQSVQLTSLSELQAAGANVIRIGLEPRNWGPPGVYDDSIALIKAAYARGLSPIVIVPLQYPATAARRSYNPAYPDIWAAYPLSQSDPTLFTSWFIPILAQLEASGVVLAGLELGNEINSAPFNGDFPVPGQGNVFGDADLYSNSEAEVIAGGYRAYMLSLQALRQIRDASALNQATPVISAGLSNTGAPRSGGVSVDGVAVDAVSINATLDYLRAYGLDTTADSYGIHFYPNANATSAQRYNDLADNALTQCGKYGPSCTVTEWGFRLPKITCPLNDSSRYNLAYEILTDVASWGSAVRSMIWFDWLSAQFGLYQCGAETATGHLVLGH
jgi:hypothetical protein